MQGGVVCRTPECMVFCSLLLTSLTGSPLGPPVRISLSLLLWSPASL
jgi:hypothetical protein